MSFARRQGSLVIESLVSVGLIALLTVAMAGLVMSNVRVTRAAADQSHATALAKEALEQIFAAKRTSWSTIADLDGYYTVSSNADGSYRFTPDMATPHGTMIDTLYRRSIHIAKGYRTPAGILADDGVTLDPEVRKATVVVSWKQQQVESSITLAAYFTHWNGN